MTLVEVRHDRVRSGMPLVDLLLLELPVAQPIIARIAANVPADYPHRMDQVLLVAAVAVAAKLRARPTL